jgi:hypothetical protein
VERLPIERKERCAFLRRCPVGGPLRTRVMAEDKRQGNLYITLSLSQEEARTGTQRRSALPNGQRSPLLIACTLLLILMLLLGGSLVLYTTIYVPYRANSDARATAVAQATQVAQANATAFARQAATAAAIGHATAVAQAQLQNDYTRITASPPYLSDSLQTPYVADWDINSNCRFFGQAYHITSSTQKTIALCLAANTSLNNLRDFAFQIHMNILRGDGGGIVIRADATASQNYLLKISAKGEFELDYYPDQTGKTAQTLASDSSTLLKTGFNQDNTICVIARGDTMNFYFNGQYATTVKDSSLASGRIGVTADDGTNATEVAYTQAQVWTL